MQYKASIWIYRVLLDKRTWLFIPLAENVTRASLCYRVPVVHERRELASGGYECSRERYHVATVRIYVAPKSLTAHIPSLGPLPSTNIDPSYHLSPLSLSLPLSHTLPPSPFLSFDGLYDRSWRTCSRMNGEMLRVRGRSST